MHKHWIRLTACFMAMLILAGCQSSGSGQQGTTAPEQGQQGQILPPETTVPEVSSPLKDPVVSSPITPPDGLLHPEMTQIRLDYRQTNWKEAFNTAEGCFLLAEDGSSLTEGLAEAGITAQVLDTSAYDEAFFRENRLMVIPMTTNSGSFRFEVSVALDGNTASVSLKGKLPGDAGTTDMADWLVLVVLPREEYPAEWTITLVNKQTNNGDLVVSDR